MTWAVGARGDVGRMQVEVRVNNDIELHNSTRIKLTADFEYRSIWLALSAVVYIARQVAR